MMYRSSEPGVDRTNRKRDPILVLGLGLLVLLQTR